MGKDERLLRWYRFEESLANFLYGMLWIGGVGFVGMFIFLYLEISPIVPVLMIAAGLTATLIGIAMSFISPLIERRMKRQGNQKMAVHARHHTASSKPLVEVLREALLGAVTFMTLGMVGVLLDGELPRHLNMNGLRTFLIGFGFFFLICLIYLTLHHRLWRR